MGPWKLYVMSQGVLVYASVVAGGFSMDKGESIR